MHNSQRQNPRRSVTVNTKVEVREIEKESKDADAEVASIQRRPSDGYSAELGANKGLDGKPPWIPSHKNYNPKGRRSGSLSPLSPSPSDNRRHSFPAPIRRESIKPIQKRSMSVVSSVSIMSPSAFPLPSKLKPMCTSPDFIQEFGVGSNYQSKLPQGWRERKAREHRDQALMEATGILHDIGYYKKINPEPTEELRIREASNAIDMRCGSSWSWNKYQKATALETKRKGGAQPFRAPAPQKPTTPRLHDMWQKRQDGENMQSIIDACKKSKRLRNTVRRVMMGWQMAKELAGIIVWIDNMLHAELIQKRVDAMVGGPRRRVLEGVMRAWYLFKPLRCIGRWRKNASHARRVQENEERLKKEAEELAKSQFAFDFLAAVDLDGDGGLSLCELKAAELGETETGNPLFVKASLWLQANRNFQKYDVNADGIIEEPELIEAMKVFQKDHWKFDGVLWDL